MKSELVFEVETPDYLRVFPEEGQSEEYFKGKESELEKFRTDFAKQLHKSVTEELGTYFLKKDVSCSFEEWWLENAEELSVDGYDFEDYGIKITIKKTDTVLGEEKGKKKERKEDNCESKSEVSPPDASRLNERSALSQELIHYVYTGGDCQGLNRVKKEMYLKTDVDSFLEAARKELKEKLCISSRKETPFNARLCGLKNAKRCENCKKIDAVFGGERK